MKKSFFLSVLLLLFFDCSANTLNNFDKQDQPSAITWYKNNGRFGDQLISYSRAQWLSHKFNIPLLYVPFNYSDQLMIHEKENIYSEKSKQLFSHIVRLPTEFNFELIPNNNTLYISYWKIEVTIDWNDNVFLEKLRKNICPRYTLNKIITPDGCISVAVHVRTGGGFYFDTEQKTALHPLQFVSEEFFIEQIEYLADMFNDQNLYVYIFTDHQQPEILKKNFKKALNNPRITFDCRLNDNSHSSNVLEDFFSMMDFHCLIRPASNFSKFVQYIGNNKIVIYPSGSHKNAQGKPVIDAISIHTRAEVGDRWNTRKIKKITLA